MLMEEDLPTHIWNDLILSKLDLKDCVRFGAVSRSWRSLAAEYLNLLNRLPWLMVSRNEETHVGTFFNLIDSKTYHLNLTPLASHSDTHCSGSSKGYLIMASNDANFLFNPFTQNLIHLPVQYVYPNHKGGRGLRYYFHKTTLSVIPNTSQYLVSAICADSTIIQMCRPYDPEWAVFGIVKEKERDYSVPIILMYDSSDDDESEEKDGKNRKEENESDREEIGTNGERDGKELDEEELEKNGEAKDVEQGESSAEENVNTRLFSEILLYKGMLYGLTRSNQLMTFEFIDPTIPPVCNLLDVLPMDRPHNACIPSYLVESNGELLMVYRCLYSSIKVNNHNHTKFYKFVTTKFVVFRLDQSSGPLKWIEVESLGDEMLFLGKNTSLSVSAKGLPGFKGNCIYFTEDVWNYFWAGWSYRHQFTDNGIFYLEDGRIETFFSGDFKCELFWVTPEIRLGDI